MSAAYNEKQKKLVLPEFEYFFFSGFQVIERGLAD